MSRNADIGPGTNCSSYVSKFICVFLYHAEELRILYLAGSPPWQKLLLSSFTRGIQAFLWWKSSLNCCPQPSRFWQSIYQYFKSRSLHATQINFDKIRFSQIMFTNSDPYPIFLPAKFYRNRRRTNSTEDFILKRAKKSPSIIQSSVYDETQWMAIFCIWNPDFLSHWSRSLSLIFVLENSKPDPEA